MVETRTSRICEVGRNQSKGNQALEKRHPRTLCVRSIRHTLFINVSPSTVTEKANDGSGSARETSGPANATATETTGRRTLDSRTMAS